MSIGSLFNGLWFGVSVVESQGTSVFSPNGKPFSARAIRTLRAYGDGAALMSVHIFDRSIAIEVEPILDKCSDSGLSMEMFH